MKPEPDSVLGFLSEIGTLIGKPPIEIGRIEAVVARRPRKDFLAEYDSKIMFDGTHGVTFRLFGKVRRDVSLRSGGCVENLEAYLGDADVTAALPESLLQAFTNAILEEYK